MQLLWSDEGKNSAAPVVNPEKWSHEDQMYDLSVCRNSKWRRIRGRIRGLTFYKSVGMMTRRKQIVIKKVLVKFPQWGVACEITVEVEPGRSLLPWTG
jgi:hypothetical protein